MYETILLPVDGSESSMRAADQAFRLADNSEATVHILSVVDTSRYGTTALSSTELIFDELETTAASVIETLESEAADRGIATEGHLSHGQPSKEIATYGAEIDADLIVIGQKGQSRGSTTPIGSVAERVVRQAAVPVFVT